MVLASSSLFPMRIQTYIRFFHWWSHYTMSAPRSSKHSRSSAVMRGAVHCDTVICTLHSTPMHLSLY